MPYLPPFRTPYHPKEACQAPWLQCSARSRLPSRFFVSFSRSLPHLRWVEPVFVQISYNGKVLVERTKIFPNGSQRKHSTVLAEKKARGKCVDFDLLTLLEARSWLAASHCFRNRSSQRVCRTWVLSRGSAVIWVVLVFQLRDSPTALKLVV